MGIMGTLRGSGLLRRGKMQRPRGTDWLRILAISGIIIIPVLFGILVQ